MEQLSLIERFANPEMLSQMPLNEKLMGALIVTVLGMGITFIVLMLLWGLILIMTKLLTKPVKKPETTVVVSAPVAATQTIGAVEEDATELIAVITAAIAASLKTSVDNVIVRNIVRTQDTIPAWAKAGKNEQLGSRF